MTRLSIMFSMMQVGPCYLWAMFKYLNGIHYNNCPVQKLYPPRCALRAVLGDLLCNILRSISSIANRMTTSTITNTTRNTSSGVLSKKRSRRARNLQKLNYLNYFRILHLHICHPLLIIKYNYLNRESWEECCMKQTSIDKTRLLKNKRGHSQIQLTTLYLPPFHIP